MKLHTDNYTLNIYLGYVYCYVMKTKLVEGQLLFLWQHVIAELDEGVVIAPDHVPNLEEDQD